MILAHAVCDPKKPEHTLLKAGFTLDEESIGSLRKHRVSPVWVRYPNLDFLDNLIDPEIVAEKQELYGVLKDQFSDTQELCFAKINHREYTERMASLFRSMLSNRHGAAMYIADFQGEADDLFAHGTTIASLSMMIGMNLESYLIRERHRISTHLATDLTLLGVGALLHDVGKMMLPEELQSFHLTGQNRGTKEWQAHTEVGLEMIKGGLDPTAAQVVLNHHQHFDGSGFPNRKSQPGATELTEPLEKSDIHIFCRIAAIADRFEGLRHLPDGTFAPPIVALKRLRNSAYAKWFDPTVYKAFLETVLPFTPGDNVILNDGQSAVVTEVNDQQPCKPTVRPIDLSLATDTDTDNAEQQDQSPIQDINLVNHADLNIAKVGDFNVTPFLH